MKKNLTAKALVSAAAAIALFVTGCGSESAGKPAAGGQPNDLQKVSVGVVPVSTVAPLYIGIEQGFFKEVGLDVEAKSIKTSPAIVAGVLSNEIQFGFGATASLLQAKAKNMPIEVVVGGSLSEASEPGTGLLTAKDSGITSVTDLAGKTIAVNELEGQSQLGVLSAAKQAGTDPSKLTFVSLPFPEMVTALDTGRVDAAVMVQPFGTTAQKSGHAVLIPDVYKAMAPDLTVTSWFASKKYIADSEDITVRFSTALSKAFRYAQENPKAVSDIIPTYTQIPAEAAADLPLASTSPEVSMNTLKMQADAMLEFGLLDAPVDLSSYVAQPVRNEIEK